MVKKQMKNKRKCTCKTFKKAGFTKLSAKFLERKANGKKTKK